MNITTEQVKALRDITGISIMQCKKALTEAEGDIEKAKVILEKQSKASAQKKGDRELAAGAIASYVHSTGTVGSLVALSCETDFVGKNEEFKALAYDIAMHVAAASPEFLTKEDIDDKAKETVGQLIKAELGESSSDSKLLEEKMASYFKDKTLLEQPYIKNPNFTIQDLVDQASQKFGERVALTRFVRFTV